MLTESPINSISTNRWIHWDPLKSYPCKVDHAPLLRGTFFYLLSSPSHSSVRIPSRLPHFARVTSFKKNRTTEKSSLRPRRLERIAKHKGFWRFARKFHQEVNGSKLSLHWLATLSENPVEGVCGRSLFAQQMIFLTAVFSNIFFAGSRHLKEL